MFTKGTVMGLSYPELRYFVISGIFSVNSLYRIENTDETQSAINLAIIHNDDYFFDFLLNYGAYPNLFTAFTEPPLLVACRLGRTRMAHQLIKAGAIVEFVWHGTEKFYGEKLAVQRYVNEEEVGALEVLDFVDDE